jgi:sugar phosphate permease
MFSNRLAAYAAGHNIYYGWVIVLLGFTYVLFASSALGITAVLIRPMSQQLDLSVAELSASQGLRFALFGLVAPFAGGLMLRYGPRRMVAISGVLSLLGLLLTVTTTNRFELWLGFGALLGIAPGLTALQLSAVISSRWFTKHRGLVVGLMNGAIATGTLLFMPLGAWISERWGWRAALIPPSAGLLVMLMLFLLLTSDRPQELGLAPLGEASMPPIPPRVTENFVLLSYKALLIGAERPVFWVLAATFFVCGLSSYGLTQTHFVPFCGDLGFPLVTSANFLATIGICDLLGTIGSGWLSDRYDNRWLLATYYGLRGVSLVWLVTSNVSFVAMMAFAVIYGLDFIATLPPTVRLTVGNFGRETGPAVFGWVFAAHQLGVGLMALGAGVGRDALGTYGPAFLVAGVLCLIAATAFLLVQRPAQAPA